MESLPCLDARLDPKVTAQPAPSDRASESEVITRTGPVTPRRSPGRGEISDRRHTEARRTISAGEIAPAQPSSSAVRLLLYTTDPCLDGPLTAGGRGSHCEEERPGASCGGGKVRERPRGRLTTDGAWRSAHLAMDSEDDLIGTQDLSP